MNFLQNAKHEELYFSINSIGYLLTGRFIDSQNDKKLINGIKRGINGLIERENISVITQNKSEYVISGSSCYVDTKKFNFVIIKLWEIQKLFSQGAYGFPLLKFYVNIIGTINGNSSSWHMTQDDMAGQWNMSKRTVSEYIHKFEELKLLYTFHSNARKTDGTFNRVSNVYGRYMDKDIVEEEGKLYLAKVPNFPIKTFHVDRTAIKLRYNAFVNESKKYKDNRVLVRELYDDCIKYNESFKDFPNENISFLDMTVFDKYGFHKNSKHTKGNDKNIHEQWGERDMIDDYIDGLIDFAFNGTEE